MKSAARTTFIGLAACIGLRSAALIGAFAALATNPLAADVVFAESFEAPVVAGFDDNTLPTGGKWIGATDGFGSTNRGLYNETVSWPATPPFTTPYGDQAYYINYTNSGLTTAVGATGQTLTAGVTCKVTFNTAVTAGTASGNYRVELVAFGPADDNTVRQDCNGTLPGTVLANAAGTVTTNDMSAAHSITFTPDDANAHLGKEVAIRLVKSTNSVLYDNIRLIVGHDLNPDPADGEDLDAGGNVTLSWTNMPPNPPATGTCVDVWFGADPASLMRVVDGQLVSSTIVSAPQAGTWYWRIDSYPDGDPNGTPVASNVFLFTIADTDGDGLPDDYELAHTDPASNTALDPASDLDSDNLTAGQEYNYGTDPNDPDTDNDTLLDGPELVGVGSRPATSPVDPDSDDDGLADGVESNTGNWVNSADTGTNPKDADWDNDGLKDGVETRTGAFVSRTTDTGTDPYLANTDGDNADDWYEVAATLTNPNSDTEASPIPYPLPDPTGDPGNAAKPVKVYILSGQSNMYGVGYVNDFGEPGALSTIAKQENKFPNLVDGSNNWTARNDVIFKGVISDTWAGPLTVADTEIGPELGFGHMMGWFHDEDVLILKSSQGNRSLGWDFCPPGTPRFELNGYTYAGYGDTPDKWLTGSTPVPVNWYAGKQYDECFLNEAEWAPAGAAYPAVTNAADILNFTTGTLQGLPDTGNDLNGRSFEIAGFVWFQGHKDQYDSGHYTRYEQNLANLINALRSEFNAPNAPFVVGTIGFDGGGYAPGTPFHAIYNAQLNISDPVKHPAFDGNVKSVDTTPYWRTLAESPGGQGYHYNNNAETYMLVGDAMGRAMIELINAAAGPDEIPPVVTNLSPANGASDVSTGANLVATFNELIAIGTGNITLRNLTDSTESTIALTDATQVSVSGATLTINPAANLAPSKQYAILLDATAIDDLAGNSYAGIGNNTTWSFTTATPDLTAPTLSTVNPANGAAGVLPDANLVATFSEPVAAGSGSITLRNLTDGTEATIPATDGSQVSISGAVLTINPTADLVEGKTYAVRIGATAIDDLVGNSYAGITDDATWSFSTPEPPPVGLLFSDDFEFPDVTVAQSGSTGSGGTSKMIDTTKWVRATQGFGASANGIEDEGAGRFIDPVGEQAYRFCYTNSGVTTAFGVIGNLTAGTTYTVSFKVVADAGATPYNMQFVTFDGAGTRNDVRSDSFVSKVLVARSGNAPGDGSYGTVSFEFTPDPVLHAAFIGHDLALRFKGATTSSNIDNVSVTTTGGGTGPGPVASFVIAPIASPQTVGTPITGITITAKDAANETATGFTGTVTFGGTGGFSGTSAAFTAGVLTGVSLTPTVAGSNLALTVNDGAGHSGSSTIATIQTRYQAWAGGVVFDGDANGDGVDNGMAWLLGATDPDADATGLLPEPGRNGNDLVLTFSCLNAASRGGAVLSVQHSSDAGVRDRWTSVQVPESSDTVGGITFHVTPGGNRNEVVATIPAGAGASGRLFGRLLASQ